VVNGGGIGPADPFQRDGAESLNNATDPAQQAWLAAELTPHPLGTYETPLTLKNKFGNGLPITYISCTDPAYPPLNASKEWARKNNIKMVDLKTGHDAMVTVPDKLTDMLDADSV